MSGEPVLMNCVVARRYVPTPDQRFRLAIDDGFQCLPKILRGLRHAYFFFAAVRTGDQRHQCIFGTVADADLKRGCRLAERSADTRRTGVTDNLSFVGACAPVVDVRDHAVKNRTPFEQMANRRACFDEPTRRIDQQAEQLAVVIAFFFYLN